MLFLFYVLILFALIINYTFLRVTFVISFILIRDSLISNLFLVDLIDLFLIVFIFQSQNYSWIIIIEFSIEVITIKIIK